MYKTQCWKKLRCTGLLCLENLNEFSTRSARTPRISLAPVVQPSSGLVSEVAGVSGAVSGVSGDVGLPACFLERRERDAMTSDDPCDERCLRRRRRPVATFGDPSSICPNSFARRSRICTCFVKDWSGGIPVDSLVEVLYQYSSFRPKGPVHSFPAFASSERSRRSSAGR